MATHRRLAFVAGEANLWPSLTRAETLALLGLTKFAGRSREGRRLSTAIRLI